MLSATLDGLGSSLFTIVEYSTIRVLFPDVSFIWQVPLVRWGNEGRVQGSNDVNAHTAFKITTIRVPISLGGVEAIEGVAEMMGVEVNWCTYTSGLIETVHTRVPQPQMSTIRFMPGALSLPSIRRFAVSLTCKSNLNKLCPKQNNFSLRKRILTLLAATHYIYINRQIVPNPLLPYSLDLTPS